jgi:DNA polymerase elongation subunit (family B)
MRKSFADCSKCKLFECDGKVCETNCPKNISEVKVLYLVDKVEWLEDIKHYAENQNQKYLITFPVLCQSEEPLSTTEYEEIMGLCKINANTIISKCNPEQVIAIGIYSCHVKVKPETKIDVYQDFEAFVESIGSNDKIENDLIEDLNLFNETIPITTKAEKSELDVEVWGSTKAPYTFKIPEKYYTDEYKLVDVQTIMNQSRVIYIFRDKNNKKEYYEVPIKEDDFYWYESLSADNKIIESLDNLELKIGNYKNRCIDITGYGGDMDLATVHSVDYFLNNIEEASVNNKNILHFDIEVYTYKDRIFPDPSESKYPINAISFRLNENDVEHIYLLKIDNHIDPKIDDIVKSGKYPTLTLFTSEYTMICAFLEYIRKTDPDFICGWNSSYFDFPYIIGRMRKLNIPMKNLSPFGNVYAGNNGKVIITGYVPLDQLTLYKDQNQTKLPSYSLDAVAKEENVGEKTPYDGNLNTLYNDNIDKFIEYSLNDTFLIKGIEDKTQHISIQDELRRISTNSHSGASTTLGQAEGLLASSMKKQGLIARNKNEYSMKEKYPGAYVFDVKGGLYEGLLCDFDFTSLYPSIINTWNLGPDTFIAFVVNEDDMFNLIYHRELLKDKKIEIIKDPIYNTKTEKVTLDELDRFIKSKNANLNISGAIFAGRDVDQSILYTVIDFLFKNRKTYKKKMLEAKESKDSLNENIYNGKQLAYKILANSIYGALGNEYFRFYNINLAKSITLPGQELLKYCTVHCDHFMHAGGQIDSFVMDKKFMDKVKSLTYVVYGDTDSMFVYLTDYLKNKGIDYKDRSKSQDEINKIQSFINDVAIGEFLKVHNIERKDSIIYLKNEFLFSKYYTLNVKKHYATKVISQEGKDINYIDVKGLEIKRSDYPSRSQELLSDILDVILEDDIKKSDIKLKVDQIVSDAKKEMLELIRKRDNSVVRAVSFSKPLSEYKNRPQHIKAMLIWNTLMYEDFRFGTKGKLWNLTGIDLNKAPSMVKDNYHNKFLKKFNVKDLDCICLPEDVRSLPEWFIPDVKKIMSYACDERVNNLTEPLWKESEDILLF